MSNELQKDDVTKPSDIDLGTIWVDGERKKVTAVEKKFEDHGQWQMRSTKFTFAPLKEEPKTEDAEFEVLPTELPESTKKFIEFHNQQLKQLNEYVANNIGIPQEREGSILPPKQLTNNAK